MFSSPVDDITLWTFTSVSLAVPSDANLRYPGYGVRGATCTAASALTVRLPVKSFIKLREAGSTTVIELEPLLVSNPDLAKKITAGFPTIYIAVPATGLTFTDGLYDAGFSLGLYSSFSIGIQFSDRVEREISHAADLILAALQDLVNTDSWRSFCEAIRSLAGILFLDANGSAFKTNQRLRFVSGAADEQFDFFPGTTQLSDIFNNRTGTLSLVSPDTDPVTNQLWVNTDKNGNAVISAGSTEVSADTRIILFAQITQWMAPQSRTDFLHPIPRFTWHNKITTFINGPDYYNDLFPELNNAASTDGKFFLCGYSIFQDDKLVTSEDDIPKTLLEATKKIVDNGGQCYYLPLQLFQLKHNGDAIQPQQVLIVATLVTLLIADIGIILFLSDKQKGNKVTTPIIASLVFAGAAAAMLLAKQIIESDFVLDKLRNLASSADDLAYENGAGKSRRIWAIHPATWEDNSFQGNTSGFPALDLAKDLLPGVNAYHQKIAVVKKADGWVAYCGGIDLNPNRMDDARHLAIGPYHDVHARVDGPAVRALAITIMDRWNDEAPDDTVAMGDADLPAVTPLANGHDIVQVARTNYQPNPTTGGDRAFDYALTGDRTILDTLLASIRSAKEYIYIEDQYFTPTPEYQQALIDALDNGLKSLIVVMPSEPQQFYSESVRNSLVERLLAYNTADNTRVRIGYARRRYLLPSTQSMVMTGRLMLGIDVAEDDAFIWLGPVSRVASFPFWVSVSGEIMLVTGKTPTGTGESDINTIPGADHTYKTYDKYNVERGTPTNFFDEQVGCKKRKHKAGTPVTIVSFDGIYVHAKCMMIDDIFASIGSANMNRRGYHSDAEANIFFIPDGLRFKATLADGTRRENPVAALRKKSWSEFLDIPNTMGQTLLDDPVAASKLFDRDSSTGCRFIPLKAISTQVKSYANKVGDITISTDSFHVMDTIKDVLSALAIGTEILNFDEIFFYVTDPSSYSENPPEHS